LISFPFSFCGVVESLSESLEIPSGNPRKAVSEVIQYSGSKEVICIKE